MTPIHSFPRQSAALPALSVALTFLLVGSAAMAAPGFHADVAPIFREYCAGCHNADDMEGELSVETFASLMKGGESGKPVVPGRASGSLLIKLLKGEKKPKMPPKREAQPDGKAIATIEAWINAGAKGPVKDISILKELTVPKIATVKGAARSITAAAYSPNGKWVALARYRAVELRDAKTRKVVRRFGGHPGKVNAVHFSKNGNRLITASGITGHSGVAILWDSQSGQRIREFGATHRDVLYDAELSPDGKTLVTAGYDRFMRYWNVADGNEIRSHEGHNGAIFDLAFSPDGKIVASASADETVKLWKVENGHRLDTLNQPEGEQFAVGFTRDGSYVIAGGADKQIRLWRLVSRDKPRINPLFLARFAHEDDVTALEVSADGRTLVSTSADLTIKTWGLPKLVPGQIFSGQRDVVTSLTMAPDNRTLRFGRIDGSWNKLTVNPIKPIAKGKPKFAGSMRHRITGELQKAVEKEPNDSPDLAMKIAAPVVVTGAVHNPNPSASDPDHYRFSANAGQEWVMEINAARSKSPMDSRVEVLDLSGQPIVRTRLQAVRDTWLTFRGKDSKVATDFRLFKWREMSLNQLLYVNGEVVKLWHYPRGPDSGFIVYPGTGTRWGYFDTTPLAHPLGQNAYIVEPLATGSEALPNGLPVFPIYYANDDESSRQFGTDSQLTFTAPKDGDYLVKVSDVRGFQGSDFKYTLTVRARQPDFKVTVSGVATGAVPLGSGREFKVSAVRMDHFSGPINVEVKDVPEGFHVTSPMVIEAGQNFTFGSIYAATNAVNPKTDVVKVFANAEIRGKTVTHAVNNLKGFKSMPAPKVLAWVTADGQLAADISWTKPVELTIAPGETISARVHIKRNDFKARVGFGKHDAGRGLPHGVYVDNIGLNGLLIVEEQNDREFFITADKWVPDSTSVFYLKCDPEKGLTTPPILLKVRKNKELAAN
ncbi:MAG: WD40 repeat protein [Yoonia sp.]|jgi:WD40 repeat protein